MAATTTSAELAEYRDYIRRLLRKRELPTRQVTVMHRDVFGLAGVPWRDGQPMEELLSALHMGELIALANQLRDTDIDEESDDA